MRRLGLRTGKVAFHQGLGGSKRVSSLTGSGTSRNDCFRAVRLLALAIALGPLFASPFAVAAPPAKSGRPAPKPVDMDLPGKSNEIKSILRTGKIDPADQELFDNYFNNFLFEQFTNPWQGMKQAVYRYSLDDLPRLCKDLRNFLLLDKSGSAYKHLNDLVLKKCGELVKGQYPSHDAAIKVNAVLLLGELNETDESGKPKPWAKPFGALVGIMVGSAQKYPDHLKAAAMVGIERYAAAGAIPADSSKKVIDALVALVNQQVPPAGRDSEVHQFMRRNAGQILAHIGNPGPDNSVVKALEKSAADPKMRPTLRCEMALFIGQLKIPPATKIDMQGLANAVGHEAVDVCKQELDSAKTANRPPSRRILLLALLTAKEALVGGDSKSGLTAATAGAPAQKFIGNLYGKVKAMQTECESSDTDTLVDAEVTEINAKLADLESSLVAQAPAKAAPVAAAAAGKQAVKQ